MVYAGTFSHLDSKGNYSATSNNTKLVHLPLMGGLLHLVQRGIVQWLGVELCKLSLQASKIHFCIHKM